MGLALYISQLPLPPQLGEFLFHVMLEATFSQLELKHLRNLIGAEWSRVAGQGRAGQSGPSPVELSS